MQDIKEVPELVMKPAAAAASAAIGESAIQAEDESKTGGAAAETLPSVEAAADGPVQGSGGSLEELAMEDVGQDAAQPDEAVAPHIDSERYRTPYHGRDRVAERA